MYIEVICHIFLKNLVFQLKNLVFRLKTQYFGRRTSYFDQNLVFRCVTQILIKKLGFSNRKSKFFNSHTKEPSFPIKTFGFQLKSPEIRYCFCQN